MKKLSLKIILGLFILLIISFPYIYASADVDTKDGTAITSTSNIDGFTSNIDKYDGQTIQQTAYESYDAEDYNSGNPDKDEWFELDELDSYDDSPQCFSVETSSPLAGSYSLLFDADALGVGVGTSGVWNYTGTEWTLTFKMKIVSGDSPDNGDAIWFNNYNASANYEAGVVVLWYTTTDSKWHINVRYAEDGQAATYVEGSAAADGPALTVDTTYTIYFYHKSGSGSDGINAFKIDDGSWYSDTSLDLDGRTWTDYRIGAYGFAGNLQNDDMTVIYDDIKIQDSPTP